MYFDIRTVPGILGNKLQEAVINLDKDPYEAGHTATACASGLGRCCTITNKPVKKRAGVIRRSHVTLTCVADLSSNSSRGILYLQYALCRAIALYKP